MQLDFLRSNISRKAEAPAASVHSRTHDVAALLHLHVLEKKPQYIGIDAAKSRIRQYCAYQERAHSEVREKLAEFGIFGDQADEVSAELVDENYLNEERFAKAFAGGKFRMKKWGKDKIRFELKKKGVSAACIKIGMNEIDFDEYERIFRSLADEKLRNLRSEKNHFTKKRKLTDFLRAKGYEFEMISRFINEIERIENRK